MLFRHHINYGRFFMKRTVALLVGFAFLLAVGAFALAEEAKKEPVAKPEPKMIHKTVMGKVAELTDTSLKLTRTVKGKEETMEFVLDKPLKGIAAGDEVKLIFHEKDGKNIVLKAVHKGEVPKPTERKEPAPK
jgi:Cu/Ag efflux protein CusF